MEKWKPYSDEWYRAANQLARDFAPRIYPCKKCGYPVADGYICRNCKDDNPSEATP